MSERVLLLYSPAGGGHRAAAHAVADAVRAASPAAVTEVRDVCEFAPSWFRYDHAWSLIQRHGGRTWDWMFDATDRTEVRALQRVRLPLHAAVFAGLDRHLRATRPTHVVCTHYLPALALARVRADVALRAITVVTDHQIHRAWLTPGVDAYCVADDAAARALARRDPAVAVEVTGIPVARAAAMPVRAIAADAPRRRVLALLGGVPAADAVAALTALAPVVAAGHALHVLTGDEPAVRAAAARLAAAPGVEVAARADGLLRALDAADVVVTKAGGLIVSECLARGRALVLPFAAPGQERGNLRHAVDVGAAVRPAELADTGAVVAELLAEPGRLRRMGARARMASRPDAADAVARCVLADVAEERRRVA